MANVGRAGHHLLPTLQMRPDLETPSLTPPLASGITGGHGPLGNAKAWTRGLHCLAVLVYVTQGCIAMTKERCRPEQGSMEGGLERDSRVNRTVEHIRAAPDIVVCFHRTPWTSLGAVKSQIPVCAARRRTGSLRFSTELTPPSQSSLLAATSLRRATVLTQSQEGLR